MCPRLFSGTIFELSERHFNAVLHLQTMNNVLVTGSFDQYVKFSNASTGEFINSNYKTGPISSLWVDENKIISSSTSGAIDVHDYKGDIIKTTEVTGEIYCMTIAETNNFTKLAVGTRTLKVFDL